MRDFLHYQLAQAEAREAKQDWERASNKMVLTKIRERLAEIRSQHEPLNKLLEMDHEMSDRDRMCAAAFYVVVGRLPEGPDA